MLRLAHPGPGRATVTRMSERTAATIAAEIEQLFVDFPRDPDRVLARVAELYAADVVFTDPIQSIRGREAFVAMNRRLLASMRELSFDFSARAAEGDHVFYAWTMSLTPKLGPRMTIDGTTHLVVEDGFVKRHDDHWDLLSGVMGAVPGVGPLYRALVARLG